MKIAIILVFALACISWLGAKLMGAYISSTPEEIVKMKFNIPSNAQVIAGIMIGISALSIIVGIILLLIYLL